VQLSKFCSQFGEREVESLTTQEILSFLTQITEGTKQSIKKLRYSRLSAFFNFIIHSSDLNIQNPCENQILRKMFKNPKVTQWKIIDKEVVGEIIFKIIKPRNRLLIELMARGGMRVGEVLSIRPVDIEDQKIAIKNPKSGCSSEIIFIPFKLVDRLKTYVRDIGIEPDDKIFPITYACARLVVKHAGDIVGIHLKPHDLRRHAATYASRSGVPIEIISKIILRHASLAITQRYLGKVSDAEAIKWIENLYG